MPNYYRPKPSPRCPNCGKVYMAAPQLAHHIMNASRLCKPRAVQLAAILRYHVSGAIERGEAEPIIEQRA